LTERYFVEIHAAGSAEKHEIAGPRAIIGTSNACSIRPQNVSGLQPEHLRLAPCAAGCEVGLMPGVRGPLMHRGAPLWVVLAPWGEEVFLDDVRFTVLRESTPTKMASPVLLVALALAAVFTLASFLRSSDDDIASGKEPEPPALVASQAACPESDPTRSALLARERERAALAKEERSVFSVSDGTRALTALNEAAACYQSTGALDDAARLRGEAVRWSARMTEEYAASRIRRRAALEHERWAEALAAVGGLQSLLTEQRTSPYFTWLTKVRQALRRRQ